MFTGHFLKLIFSIVFFVGSTTQAVDQAKLKTMWTSEIMSYFNSSTLEHFTGKDKIRIAYRKFLNVGEASHKAIVLVNGRSEFMEKYAELLFDLRSSSYNIYTYDHRGQGSSERLITNSQIGHVHSFNDYVVDLKTFIDTVVSTPTNPQKVYILGHSMGGAIATLYSMENPHDVEAMVLSSPMYKINTSGVPDWLINLAGGVIDSKALAPGRTATEWKDPFDLEKDDSTHSPERYNLPLSFLLANPDCAIGGPSIGWVQEALKVTHQLQKRLKKFIVPTLILQAKEDTITDNDGHSEICSRSNCSIKVMAGSRHDIFEEIDSIRKPAIEAALDFFSTPRN